MRRRCRAGWGLVDGHYGFKAWQDWLDLEQRQAHAFKLIDLRSHQPSRGGYFGVQDVKDSTDGFIELGMSPLAFGPSTGPWDTISWMAISDAPANGNQIIRWKLPKMFTVDRARGV